MIGFISVALMIYAAQNLTYILRVFRGFSSDINSFLIIGTFSINDSNLMRECLHGRTTEMAQKCIPRFWGIVGWEFRPRSRVPSTIRCGVWLTDLISIERSITCPPEVPLTQTPELQRPAQSR